MNNTLENKCHGTMLLTEQRWVTDSITATEQCVYIYIYIQSLKSFEVKIEKIREKEKILANIFNVN